MKDLVTVDRFGMWDGGGCSSDANRLVCERGKKHRGLC